jgi:hypothetical protein
MKSIYHLPQFGEEWFKPESQHLISEVIEKLDHNSKCVEIGSWKGKSAAYTCEKIINSKKKIHLDCIDTWEGSVEHKEFPNLHRLYDIFIRNMKPFEKYYTPIRMSSMEAVKLYEDESLDFIFIDASHEYEDVKYDINYWFPKLKKGCVISGDDYNNPGFPGVAKAVNEFFSNNNIHLNVSYQTWWGTKN